MAFDAVIMHWPDLAAFTGYLQGVPRPAWCRGITNHNTYVPNETQWRGMASMQSMMQTYIGKGWSAGPHLYLAADAPNPADRGIWQMTPLAHIGVHAGPCNSDHLGIENVGDFDARPPSPAQYQLLLAVNRAILGAWGLSPQSVKVHNECMPGRTCPGRYLDPNKLRADLASPPPLDDVWSLWGTRFPLPPEQHAWGIPQLWRENAAWLGEARSDEIYIAAGVSVRSFQGGLIYYEAAGGRCSLGRFATRIA